MKMWLKKRQLFFRYRMHRLAIRLRRISSLLFVVLGTSIFLVLFLVAEGRLIKRDELFQKTTRYRVFGMLMEEVPAAQPGSSATATTRPIAGVVEIGGFRVNTDGTGRYDLTFFSPTARDIAAIYRAGARQTVERINFIDAQVEQQRDVLFR